LHWKRRLRTAMCQSTCCKRSTSDNSTMRERNKLLPRKNAAKSPTAADFHIAGRRSQ
jgi:uncharacterized protein YcbK (DUF882 family)